MTRQVILIAGEPQEFYEVSDFFRLLSAVDPLTVEFYKQGREVSEAVGISKGYAEKFDQGTFDRVRLLSSTTQAVQFVTRLGNIVQYDAAPIGDTAIVSSVPLALDAATLAALESLDLNSATLLALTRPTLPVSHASQNGALVANTAVNVFTAGANANGAIIWTAAAVDSMAAPSVLTLIAKATAPANAVDGEIIAMATSYPAAGNNYVAFQKEVPTRIAPGLGLWFIAGVATTAAVALRSCRYSLL